MKHVVITGGSSGIGLSLVKLFHEKGYKVISLDIKEPSYPIKGVCYYNVDITDYQKILEVAEPFFKIDILINNAAVQYIAPLKELKPEEIKKMIDTNITGTLNVSKAFASHLENGLIINIGSVHSFVPRENKIPYDMSKAALKMFTKEIALELKEQGTRAICVEFGAVNTPMNNNFANEEEKQQALSKQVIKHLMTAEECAEVVLELTGDKFAYMNGESIVYDCGRSLN